MRKNLDVGLADEDVINPLVGDGEQGTGEPMLGDPTEEVTIDHEGVDTKNEDLDGMELLVEAMGL